MCLLSHIFSPLLFSIMKDARQSNFFHFIEEDWGRSWFFLVVKARIKPWVLYLDLGKTDTYTNVNRKVESGLGSNKARLWETSKETVIVIGRTREDLLNRKKWGGWREVDRNHRVLHYILYTPLRCHLLTKVSILSCWETNWLILKWVKYIWIEGLFLSRICS